jgi:plastocyanin
MAPVPPAANTVEATPAIAFSPATLQVNAGETVTFAFGSVPHNVFFDAQAGAPADITGSNTNVSITRQFTTAGSYSYSCHIHPSMRGTVVVQ